MTLPFVVAGETMAPFASSRVADKHVTPPGGTGGSGGGKACSSRRRLLAGTAGTGEPMMFITYR